MAATTDRTDAPRYDADEEYQCPTCGSRLSYAHRSWACRDCGHVPYHPAD